MSPKINIKEFLSDDTIDLSLNNLQDVPVKDIAQFPKVTSLDLSNNKLSILPKSFAISLTHLVKLDLARNELKELPKNFGLLVNLKHLDLYKNRLESLPLSFGNLKSLRWLDLKENRLEPHWQQIVGPCLNAQDCKNAAKNVVNIAGIMSEEIEVELERAKELQKKKAEAEELEQKALEKKKEKLREKKKRKKAAQAEQNLANSVQNGLATMEPLPAVVDEPSEPSDKTTRHRSWKLSSTLFGIVKGLFYALSLVILSLFIVKQVNEPLYLQLMHNIRHHSGLANKDIFTFVSPRVRSTVQNVSLRAFENFTTLVSAAWAQTIYSLRYFYKFVTTDPKFETYLNIFINSFLRFHLVLCQLSSTVVNALLYPINLLNGN